MEKEEILQEIKKAEEKSKKILADAEENHKKNLVELGSEMEKLLETKKQELDLEIENYFRIESDRITMEKQRAISEGTIEIEKVREKAIDKKEKAVDFIIEKFMVYINALERKND